MGDTVKSMVVEMSNTYTEVLDGHASPPTPAIALASSPAPTSDLWPCLQLQAFSFFVDYYFILFKEKKLSFCFKNYLL